MATTIGGRGSDDRRASVLAAPETGGERSGPEVPAHRAGRRFQVHATGLRLALGYVSVAVTSMIALAFLIPLALIVRQMSHERALADAERQAVVQNVQGGQSYLEPVDVGGGRTVVVEVFIPESELSRGVRSAWYALSADALGLVIPSVLVTDRLAGKVVGSARGFAAAARALGDGELDVRVRPSGPRELVEAGVAFNTMADRIVALLSNERELVADLSHRLRTPL